MLHTAQLQLHFSTRVHTWFHAVFRMETSIISRENKILHMTRRGISLGIHMWVYMTCVFYTARLLAMEASYTIHESDY